MTHGNESTPRVLHGHSTYIDSALALTCQVIYFSVLSANRPRAFALVHLEEEVADYESHFLSDHDDRSSAVEFGGSPVMSSRKGDGGTKNNPPVAGLLKSSRRS
jgi:hypothetical protein